MICRNCGRATCPTLTMPPVVRVIGNLKVSGGNEGAQRRVALKDCRAHAVDWFDRAQALQAELDALREKDRWIPVGERLPQSDGMTVLTDQHDLAFFVNGKWLERDRACELEVTHWRPLPKPPEEVNP